MAQLEGRYHAQTKVLQILRHILSLGSRAVTSTPVSMAVIPVQNNYRTIITLATRTFPRDNTRKRRAWSWLRRISLKTAKKIQILTKNGF